MNDGLVQLSFEGEFATIAINNPTKRNALSLPVMQALIGAFEQVAASAARGAILFGTGPMFCSGHDFNDMAERGYAEMREVFRLCTRLMDTIQAIPQPVLARVHGSAIGAGCQLAATCDLVVAADDAQFITAGGKSGWFCHTPMVAVSRNVGRKRALEMLLTGRPIPAPQAADWGLINYAVPAAELAAFAQQLLADATRGSAVSLGIGKQAFYAQIDLDQPKAYAYASETMAASSQVPDAQARMRAFLDKRRAG